MWPDGKPVCTRCQRTDKVYTMSKEFQYKCGHCTRWFNVKTLTALHATKKPLSDWIYAIYEMYTERKGISALALCKKLGVTHSTAWHMMHKLRYSYRHNRTKIKGIVQADEAYFGGREPNKHANKRIKVTNSLEKTGMKFVQLGGVGGK